MADLRMCSSESCWACGGEMLGEASLRNLGFIINFIALQIKAQCLQQYYGITKQRLAQQILIMRKQNNSYFAKHKQSLKHSHPVKSSKSLHEQELKVHMAVADKNSLSGQVLEGVSHTYLEGTSEEQKIYEQYKQYKEKYEKELKMLEDSITKIRRESENEEKKIRQAEATLETKKKELKLTQERYLEMSQAVEQEESTEATEAKILKLEQQITSMSEDNLKKIKAINLEEESARKENNELKNKLAELEEEYKKHMEFDYKEFEERKKMLEEEEQGLVKELEGIEAENLKIRKDIEKIQNMKPVSGEVHKKYLDLFEKMFISQEIGKAERIMSLKEEERKQTIECNRRKEWLREKQQEINARERRIREKDQLIEKLTNDIKEKSTLLLNKYQVDSHKTKR